MTRIILRGLAAAKSALGWKERPIAWLAPTFGGESLCSLAGLSACSRRLPRITPHASLRPGRRGLNSVLGNKTQTSWEVVGLGLLPGAACSVLIDLPPYKAALLQGAGRL
jgi:hypothetical protein